jgi:hypothetical protein
MAGLCDSFLCMCVALVDSFLHSYLLALNSQYSFITKLHTEQPAASAALELPVLGCNRILLCKPRALTSESLSGDPEVAFWDTFRIKKEHVCAVMQ